jgi:hypothetical protein
MITFVRRFVALPGKLPAAIKISKELFELAKRLNGVDAAICTSVGGNLGAFSIIWQVESIGKSDENLAKLMADPGAHVLLEKLSPLLAPDSSHDHIWRHL